MTREEVIEFGNMWLEVNEDCKDSNTYAFFQMAIKALEQEDILNKLRAEIEEATAYEGLYGIYIDRAYVLQILDKYMAESEE